jgi:hypothetical protein
VTITGGYLDDDPAKTTASYEEGSTVTITATSPPSGKKFSHFTVEGGNNIDASPATITVTRNLVITTVFVDLPDDSYLSGTWSPSSGTEGSSYTTFDSGKNTTPIGKIGNKDVYGMYFANDARLVHGHGAIIQAPWQCGRLSIPMRRCGTIPTS